MATKPGIKTRREGLSALTMAFDKLANRPVKVKRKGLKLVLRKLCYWILDRT